MPLDLLVKKPAPEVLPNEMENLIVELKKSSGSEECLKKAYQILVDRYQGQRIKTYTRIFNIFYSDINYLWRQKGFLHCNNINYIMRAFLIKSNFFKEDDIKIKWTLVWYISPHQYLQVRINEKWVNVDVWAHSFGIKFGDRARGFH
ncbi:MAG: hypothetical protein PF572_05150 [Patescibacteria group bacterium]|jgi:hypothetical protein|nr:hypothetical protein [Patescibacteria group bacterium]